MTARRQRLLLVTGLELQRPERRYSRPAAPPALVPCPCLDTVPNRQGRLCCMARLSISKIAEGLLPHSWSATRTRLQEASGS